ncbi:2-dehydro-3-deoxyphosphooctonate aldolase [Tenacibaculum sp. Bg11-29]|uniref:DUF1801 domain-containing protein n=1 Tax=Tenacibaculum sp. Bg11-29 TaxID=2058306 RepID=UPI000C33DF9E|nr:DUF1801 domain-containing protein [Tenacibaculum sp. Bg11-29]PKH52805.1 2-dehydro-3-deoxyphosphooctonate aldolase [Tenacibaculum sp. Bg11-29]
MKPAEEYILNQQEPLRTILLHLQVLIEANFTEIELLYKWKIPFYYLKGKPLCYFNATKKGYIDVGFYSKTTLKMYNEFLVIEKRKAVKSLRYYTIEEIKEEILVSVLLEAYTIRISN